MDGVFSFDSDSFKKKTCYKQILIFLINKQKI